MNRIPRIPAPVVDQIAPPVVAIPSFEPPVTGGLEQPVINMPSFDLPTYEQPTLNPQPQITIPQAPAQKPQIPETEMPSRDLDSPETPQTPVRPETEDRGVLDVPIIGEVPLPRSSEVALAGTTAMAATAAALLGKSIVEFLIKVLKPPAKKMWLKLKEARGKQFTDYELQQYFEFEGTVPEQKAAAKRLKADQQAEKTKQLEAHLQQQHQRKQRHKVSQGGSKSLDAQPRHNEEV